MAINIFLQWTHLANIREFLFQCKSLKFLAGSNKLNFKQRLFVNAELVILSIYCTIMCYGNFIQYLEFSTLVEQKIKLMMSWEENFIEKNSVYKLSDEILTFPISVLVVLFLLQQFIWIFSVTLSDNHSHLIKNIFGSTFAIIDICLIVAVIVAQHFQGIQIL
ncbi:hypothetical protein RFI_03495 [Reticulomyxa filosa]|uniref:Uncharacterized protein n=1 Tax=Reticulomyxa filosa TaxID=46433 RepID=X6P7J5_RETFI|nr:hypothetical protein RFI_03495 [Reticulomyxa filosa]|eukprot:ETO33607.1 hypothetical protein RFI_03495 [Reticulomyxa filosa]